MDTETIQDQSGDDSNSQKVIEGASRKGLFKQILNTVGLAEWSTTVAYALGFILFYGVICVRTEILICFSQQCIFKIASRLNHSCIPNATFTVCSNQDQANNIEQSFCCEIRARMPIKKGEQIFIDYVTARDRMFNQNIQVGSAVQGYAEHNPYEPLIVQNQGMMPTPVIRLSMEDRRHLLKFDYGVDCRCTVCTKYLVEQLERNRYMAGTQTAMKDDVDDEM